MSLRYEARTAATSHHLRDTSLDGSSRREVHYYPQKEEPPERVWNVRRVGGYYTAYVRTTTR